MWLLLPAVEAPVRLPSLPITWLALVWLGLLGSCLAYLLYYYLIHAWGPTRATVVTFVIPVVGLVLGILFLHETADWRLLGGAALIVGSIGIINQREREKQSAAARSAAFARNGSNQRVLRRALADAQRLLDVSTSDIAL